MIGGAGLKESIDERIHEISKQIENTKNEYDKRILHKGLVS